MSGKIVREPSGWSDTNNKRTPPTVDLSQDPYGSSRPTQNDGYKPPMTERT